MFSTDGQQDGEENQTPTASKKIRYHGTFSVYFVHVLSLDPVAYVTCMSEVNQDYQLLQTEKKKQDISRGFLFHYNLLVYFLVFWRSEIYNLVCNHADLDCWVSLSPPRLTDGHFQACDLEKLCAVLKECSSISELEWVLNAYGLYLHFFFNILRKCSLFVLQCCMENVVEK